MSTDQPLYRLHRRDVIVSKIDEVMTYSLVMKLTNSDTHSCMHSFASLDTCKQQQKTINNNRNDVSTHFPVSGDCIPHHPGNVVDGQETILLAVDSGCGFLLGRGVVFHGELEP